METSLHRLLPFLDAARAAGRSLALATVVQTAGSTYRKSGAQMLVGEDGEYAGLLSGGCLEADLREHSREVIATARAKIVRYDMRGPDDELWGLGAGCEGAMDILLQRIGPAEDWQPLASLAALARAGHWGLATVLVDEIDSLRHGVPLGATWTWRLGVDTPGPQLLAATHAGVPQAIGGAIATLAAQWAAQWAAQSVRSAGVDTSAGMALLGLPYAPPPSLLLLGAGPDARPVAELAHFLGWRVQVFDHRASLTGSARFPEGTTLHCHPVDQLLQHVRLAESSAVVVMSHHLDSDRGYLRAVATGNPGYVGLLGPAPRREKLLAGLTVAESAALRPRLRAPVGLDLGGRSPEAIALSIVADIHAWLHGRQRHHWE